MKKCVLLLACMWIISPLICAQQTNRENLLQTTGQLIEVEKGYSCTSVNTAVFRNNSLVTQGDEQYISYYDPEGYIVMGKRKLDSTEWTLHRSQYKGNVNDAHNIISMMVDGEGYLHVSFDHHGHPLNYCRSIAPGSLELGDKMPMTGVDERNVTYPEFYPLMGGDLLFVYRSGSSGQGNLVMNRYSIKDHTWTRVQDVLIDGEDERNAYWQLYVDELGTIHLSWVWRETWNVETNHDLCYARSFDNGMTWYKTSGEKYDLPIKASNAEYACRLPQNSELINQTSMSADASGKPYIATYWRSPDSNIPQYRMVWHDGQMWHHRQVTNRNTPFTLKGGGTKMIPMARPRIVVDGNEIFYIFRDEERGSRVSVAHAADVRTGEWKITDLTDFSVDAWEPSHDTELWKQQRKLHLFVQHTRQGDGERTEEMEPQMVYVLEADLKKKSAASDKVLGMIEKVNAYWQTNYAEHGRAFWDNAAYHTGNMEAYFLTKNPEYLQYSEDWAEHNQWMGAKSDDKLEWKYSYGESDDYVLFGDYQICFQTYADLFDIVPEEHKIARAKEVMEYQMSTPNHDYWWWADGLYMVMPVMTKLHRITGNPLYLEKLHEYLNYADSIMYDAEAGLYYRDGKYVYPKHKTLNGKKDFWARGDGWVLAGLAKVLKDLPETDRYRREYIDRFCTMARSVAACQQPEGYWTRSMLDPDHAPGAETSGTAFFTYGLLWGMNNGFLDKSVYQPVVEKAWKFLTEVALQPDGKVGYVQPIGEKAIPGQVVDANSTSNFGVGAFLLAACEMYRFELSR